MYVVVCAYMCNGGQKLPLVPSIITLVSVLVLFPEQAQLGEGGLA